MLIFILSLVIGLHLSGVVDRVYSKYNLLSNITYNKVISLSYAILNLGIIIYLGFIGTYDFMVGKIILITLISIHISLIKLLQQYLKLISTDKNCH